MTENLTRWDRKPVLPNVLAAWTCATSNNHEVKRHNKIPLFADVWKLEGENLFLVGLPQCFAARHYSSLLFVGTLLHFLAHYQHMNQWTISPHITYLLL